MLHVEPEPMSGCWLWTGGVGKSSGYGHFNVRVSVANHRTELAHRASWLFFRGEIPAGSWVLHRCDVPTCVNPDHLFLGDVVVNGADKAKKGRGVKSAIGLPFGVSRERNRSKPFRARVKKNGKLVQLGSFYTPEEAASVALAFAGTRYQQ